MTTITATYSPEDNKIRLYATSRLDPETFERIKTAGFNWAPKQGLFVAPKWTPAREDIATELAGEIEAEESTLAERAAIKAERLDILAGKKLAESGAYQRAAQGLSDRFADGQPILRGHHSERKARKDAERMESAQAKAIKLAETSNYWLYRATGVECFANMKNDPRVRANRIKTLLAELRDLQRGINAAHNGLKMWEKFTTDEQIRWALGNMDARTMQAPYSLYSAVQGDEVTPADARARCIANAETIIAGPMRRRWIAHVLNRLAFERAMLGDVARFEGELTPVILQAFAREHGAESPKATVTDPGAFQLESPVPLPLHIADACYLDLSEDDWRDLMQATGYVVPDAKPRRVSTKPAAAPLVNPTAEDAERLQRIWNLQMALACKGKPYVTPETSEVVALTQARYSANSGGSYSPFETVEIDASGARVSMQWRNMQQVRSGEPVARIRICSRGTGFHKPRHVVTITDKPSKALPLDLAALEAATRAAIDEKAAA
ncbi:DUF3560 domain-containing protein [Sphingomonas sp. RB3P16]|uniref:DUF3560 domain-containing protein n=1 Tax=Parasphingomonas frigoris TaxID=3096163 RepID=UPI002FC7F121